MAPLLFAQASAADAIVYVFTYHDFSEDNLLYKQIPSPPFFFVRLALSKSSAWSHNTH